MVRNMWMAAVWLGACGGGVKDPPVNEDSDTGDSGTDTSTDSGTDSDTGEETGDTGVEAPLTFTFNLELASFIDVDCLALNLVYAELREGRVNLGATWQQAAIDTTSVSIELPVPDASHLAQPDPGMWPDFYLGTFIPSLIEDLDADLEHDPGESIDGVGLQWPAFARGEIPEEYASLGLHAGWNVLTIGTDAAPVSTGTPSAVPIVSNLYPNGAIGFSGTYAGADDISTLRLAVLPRGAVASGDYTGLLYDQPASADWRIILQTLPLEGWIQPLGDPDYTGDSEVIVTYVDTNGSGSLDPADTLRYAACYGGQPVGPLFLMRPFDMSTALPLVLAGIVPGWLGVSYEGDAYTHLDAAVTDALVIDESCTIPW